MKLWTVWLNYPATGEGHTIMARVGYAEHSQEAIAGFAKAFGEYFAKGAEAMEGVQTNGVTKSLFAPVALKSAREMEGRANVVLSGSFHYNFS